MKKNTLVILILGSVLSYSQGSLKDSLEKNFKEKQLEIYNKELDIKLKEYAIKEKEFKILEEKAEYEKQERIQEKIKLEENQKKYEVIRKKREEELQKNEEIKLCYRNYNTNIFFEPLPILLGTFTVGIDKKLFDKKTVRLSIGYTNTENSPFYEYSTLDGFKMELQYRSFIQETKGNEGIYIGAYGYYKSLTRKYNDSTSNYNSNYNYTVKYTTQGSIVGFGVLLGYQAFIINKLTVNAYFGAGMNKRISTFNKTDLHVPVISPFGNGTLLRFGFDFGMPFKGSSKPGTVN
ncbi:MAG: DUF3575 domain-containing protein [Cytophagales bacterium]